MWGGWGEGRKSGRMGGRGNWDLYVKQYFLKQNIIFVYLLCVFTQVHMYVEACMGVRMEHEKVCFLTIWILGIKNRAEGFAVNAFIH